jgi:hypothetical protein
MSTKPLLKAKTQRFSQVQSETPQADCFIVNYDGSPASTAAMRYACQMATPQTDIIAVYLDLVPQSQDLDEIPPDRTYNARTILTAATINAQMRGVAIETEIVECRVKGPALVQCATEYGNATIFLGVEQSELDSQLNPFAEYVQQLAPADVVLVAV